MGSPRTFRAVIDRYTELDSDKADEIIKTMKHGYDFFYYRKNFPIYWITPYKIEVL